MAKKMNGKGSKVLVNFPTDSIGVMDEMRKLQGKEAVISEVHMTPKYGTMYALEGCKSKAGLPYWFLPEWLTPVGEGAEV